MSTTQQTTSFDSDSESFLDSDMARLLQMTNEVIMKIKQQTKERYY